MQLIKVTLTKVIKPNADKTMTSLFLREIRVPQSQDTSRSFKNTDLMWLYVIVLFLEFQTFFVDYADSELLVTLSMDLALSLLWPHLNLW